MAFVFVLVFVFALVLVLVLVFTISCGGGGRGGDGVGGGCMVVAVDPTMNSSCDISWSIPNTSKNSSYVIKSPGLSNSSSANLTQCAKHPWWCGVLGRRFVIRIGLMES